ncbi:sugar phosphate isomerase/epimerase family protein [Alkalicoccobacillus porphyridii]|uniref:Sugar phosphate isomerase/epimerase n=1 Tax=Alkalicoccobacillus porphyridii TaxID=2597270 RepID=A0A553ZYW0_9BACI|nr:TIM barrel protein [Alkalicoccobacillus porphyridii]TSB46633.1 sugar phosphate isomerase/epimerase [Alkalicoccobacillus porphyridii]
MIKTGMCSVTFRDQSVDTIIKWTSDVGLDGIEWGADVHAPPGELERVQSIVRQMKQAGLEVLSYGSYYKAGVTNQPHSFETILLTAKELGAPSIRIWAGEKGSDEATRQERQKVTADIHRVADLAENDGIAVHIEYHGGTLTDTSESAKQLLEAIAHQNVRLYWQPAVGLEVQDRVEDIKVVKPYLKHVHVFYWNIEERLPLAEGLHAWKQYLHQLHLEDSSEDQHFLLEFVKDNQRDQFQDDAKALLQLIADYRA